MKLPFISAKCVTYGRVSLLEEAIESFLRQDYPKNRCELIIVNDYPLQSLTLPYKVKNIKIYNFGDTFFTIGHKENFATSMCRGDIICQWDDDDIALPNHLRNVAREFVPGSTILHWDNGAYWNEPQGITDLVTLGNSGIVFSKKAWEQVGGHPLENAGYDMTFVNRLHLLGGRVNADVKDEDVSWFYRWNLTSHHCYHQSGQGTDSPGRPNILQRHKDHIEYLRQNKLIPVGKVILIPHWNHDYIKQLKDFNNVTP